MSDTPQVIPTKDLQPGDTFAWWSETTKNWHVWAEFSGEWSLFTPAPEKVVLLDRQTPLKGRKITNADMLLPGDTIWNRLTERTYILEERVRSARMWKLSGFNGMLSFETIESVYRLIDVLVPAVDHFYDSCGNRIRYVDHSRVIRGDSICVREPSDLDRLRKMVHQIAERNKAIVRKEKLGL